MALSLRFGYNDKHKRAVGLMSSALLWSFFIKVSKRNPDRFHYKGRKCTPFALDGFFYVRYHIVWKTDTLICSRGDNWYFEVLQLQGRGEAVYSEV